MKPVKLAALAFAISLGAHTIANAEAIRFGSVADFEPYNYLDDEGVLQGFEADLAEIICTRAGITCEWALAPWNDMVVELLQNEFDVIMTGMQITAARELTIDFTQEYFPADPSAFLALSAGSYPTEGTVVGAQIETLQADYVSDGGWALSSYAAPEYALQALLNNEISAFVADQAYLSEIVAANPGVYQLVAQDIVIGGGIGLGIRESSPALLASLNSAITSIKADGTLDTLIGSWFNGRDPNYRGVE